MLLKLRDWFEKLASQSAAIAEKFVLALLPSSGFARLAFSITFE